MALIFEKEFSSCRSLARTVCVVPVRSLVVPPYRVDGGCEHAFVLRWAQGVRVKAEQATGVDRREVYNRKLVVLQQQRTKVSQKSRWYKKVAKLWGSN